MTAPRVTVLITAYREAATIGRALEALLPQAAGAEVVVICPDDETAQAALAYPGVEVLHDPGAGKPAALNLGLARARGEIVAMTDGDVYVGEGALGALLAPFADPQTGAVSGRPVSTSPRDTMLGYWSHLLTDAGAHAERIKRDAAGQFFVASGYLYAVRAALVEHIPEDALAEDAVVSHIVGEQGFRVRYAPDARVYVKYPSTYRDWLKQKVRSAGGYAQPVIARSPLRMRSFRHEAVAGTTRALGYARSPREFAWTLALFAARVHLWLRIFWQVRVRRRPLLELWQRVETTK
ncbi:MAG TPA: glycosyltransferase [Aggregatilineales bacterium]|nr:glycosyltransferase [Aggregatilineales bacterium]